MQWKINLQVIKLAESYKHLYCSFVITTAIVITYVIVIIFIFINLFNNII